MSDTGNTAAVPLALLVMIFLITLVAAAVCVHVRKVKGDGGDPVEFHSPKP